MTAKERAWEEYLVTPATYEQLDMMPNSEKIAFLAGWTARQRHDAEIARNFNTFSCALSTVGVVIADAIERSE